MRDIYSSSDLPHLGERSASSLMSAQPSLFPVRVSTIYPREVTGADTLFMCEAREGGTYYCKADKDGRQIRATEWLYTKLAAHLNIVVPDCAIVENPFDGETLFGSRQLQSPASDFEAKQFLNTPQIGILGEPSEWPGRYLSGLYAVDMFIANRDRDRHNFFLQREGLQQRLFAFDFASADLKGLDGRNFPVATSATVRIGRFLRRQHGFHLRSAFEMLDRISAVPADTIASFLGPMPDDWMSYGQREGICGLWETKRIGGRLTALRTGLADGTLL